MKMRIFNVSLKTKIPRTMGLPLVLVPLLLLLLHGLLTIATTKTLSVVEVVAAILVVPHGWLLCLCLEG